MNLTANNFFTNPIYKTEKLNINFKFSTLSILKTIKNLEIIKWFAFFLIILLKIIFFYTEIPGHYCYDGEKAVLWHILIPYNKCWATAEIKLFEYIFAAQTITYIFIFSLYIFQAILFVLKLKHIKRDVEFFKVIKSKKFKLLILTPAIFWTYKKVKSDLEFIHFDMAKFSKYH